MKKQAPLVSVPLAGGEWHATRRRRVSQKAKPSVYWAARCSELLATASSVLAVASSTEFKSWKNRTDAGEGDFHALNLRFSPLFASLLSSLHLLPLPLNKSPLKQGEIINSPPIQASFHWTPPFPPPNSATPKVSKEILSQPHYSWFSCMICVGLS